MHDLISGIETFVASGVPVAIAGLILNYRFKTLDKHNSEQLETVRDLLAQRRDYRQARIGLGRFATEKAVEIEFKALQDIMQPLSGLTSLTITYVRSLTTLRQVRRRKRKASALSTEGKLYSPPYVRHRQRFTPIGYSCPRNFMASLKQLYSPLGMNWLTYLPMRTDTKALDIYGQWSFTKNQELCNMQLGQP